MGLGIVVIHSYVQRRVMTDPECVPPAAGHPQANTTTSMGMRESVRYLSASSYMRKLAVLVIAHGMSMNFVEVAWRDSLGKAFPDRFAYMGFMDNFSADAGKLTLVVMTILARFVFLKFGWTTAALTTPTALGLTGALFFSLTVFEGTLAPLLEYFGTTPVMAAVLIGAVHVRTPF